MPYPQNFQGVTEWYANVYFQKLIVLSSPLTIYVSIRDAFYASSDNNAIEIDT